MQNLVFLNFFWFCFPGYRNRALYFEDVFVLDAHSTAVAIANFWSLNLKETSWYLKKRSWVCYGIALCSNDSLTSKYAVL